jgi:hypothetical protein
VHSQNFTPPRFGWIVVVSAMLAACGGSDDPPSAPSFSQVTAQQTCDALSGKTIAGTTLTSVAVAASGPVPKYCKVTGTIQPSTNFEIRFPDVWNGKLHYNGGGGYNGSIPGLNVAALTSGYVDLGSDSGHQGNALDASFALDPQKAQLFGSLSIPLVMSSALETVKQAYGTAPQRSYYEGCSQGGREGQMAVQRNPNLFDGVIAGAPGGNATAFLGHYNLNAKALAVPGAAMSAAKTALLSKAVRDACDGLDGIVDGIVSNGAACTPAVFNPASLRCPGGADTGDTCLSDPQLGFVNSWTSDAVFVGGNRDPGWSLTGNEDSAGGWSSSVTGNGNYAFTAAYLFQDTTVKYWLARDPAANSINYVWDSDPGAIYAFAAINNATQTDIRPFRDSGAKLILWHGGADPLIGVNGAIDYYNSMVPAVGGQAQADGFARFFVLPGVLHCGGGPGASSNMNLLTALDKWVTAGTAPDALTASSLAADGTVAFQRPLCAYPKYAKYTGPANDAAAAKLASSYTCSN